MAAATSVSVQMEPGLTRHPVVPPCCTVLEMAARQHGLVTDSWSVAVPIQHVHGGSVPRACGPWQSGPHVHHTLRCTYNPMWQAGRCRRTRAIASRCIPLPLSTDRAESVAGDRWHPVDCMHRSQ